MAKKSSNFSVSVAKETSRLVSSSNCNFGGVREGSYIKIGGTDILYSIIKINSYFYLKDCIVEENKRLIIDENVFPNLQNNDEITVSFKEFELDNLLEIVNPGKNYFPDDLLVVKGGSQSINIEHGFGNPTEFKVIETDENGGIIKLSLTKSGKYISAPINPITLIGGKGENVQVTLNYDVVSNRAVIERIIEDIRFTDNKTIIQLNYSLPRGLTNCKLGCKKWEVFISANYYEDGINEEYQVFKDYTPYFSFPLLVQNSLSHHLIFNEAMNGIDKIMLKLQKRIEDLEEAEKNFDKAIMEIREQFPYDTF